MFRASATRLATLAAVAALAFGGAFFGARALTGDDGSPQPAELERLEKPFITINNLERAPTMKPLRSVAGAPPAAAPAAQAQTQQPTTDSGTAP